MFHCVIFADKNKRDCAVHHLFGITWRNDVCLYWYFSSFYIKMKWKKEDYVGCLNSIRISVLFCINYQHKLTITHFSKHLDEKWRKDWTCEITKGLSIRYKNALKEIPAQTIQ